MSASTRRSTTRVLAPGDVDPMSIERARHAVPNCRKFIATGFCTRAIGHDESDDRAGSCFSAAGQHVRADRHGVVQEVWS